MSTAVQQKAIKTDSVRVKVHGEKGVLKHDMKVSRSRHFSYIYAGGGGAAVCWVWRIGEHKLAVLIYAVVEWNVYYLLFHLVDRSSIGRWRDDGYNPWIAEVVPGTTTLHTPPPLPPVHVCLADEFIGTPKQSIVFKSKSEMMFLLGAIKWNTT